MEKISKHSLYLILTHGLEMKVEFFPVVNIFEVVQWSSLTPGKKPTNWDLEKKCFEWELYQQNIYRNKGLELKIGI